MEVKVHNNNLEKAIRLLKRKMQAEGIMKELRKRAFYESKSEKKRRTKNEAVRRYRKAQLASNLSDRKY